MARSYTRAELRTRLEQITDTEGVGHLGTTEKNMILDSAAAETLDKIYDAGLGEKNAKSVSFTASAGTIEYPLTSGVINATDFYRIHHVYAVENDRLRSIRRVNPSELLSFSAPRSSSTVKLYYLPISPKTTSDNDTFDGINGWEEHTLMTAACAIKIKREEDYRVYYNRKKELEQRIASMGMIDFAEPPRVSRKRKQYMDPWYNGFGQQVNAYGVRGDKLELYYLAGMY